MTENQVSGIIVDVGIKVHSTLGPGLFESVYEKIMEYELKKRGLFVECQVGIPVIWDGVKLDIGFKADIIVEKKVIIELKSVESLAKIHFCQLLTYLKLTNLRLGLLMNFNEKLLKNGTKRVVNKL